MDQIKDSWTVVHSLITSLPYILIGVIGGMIATLKPHVDEINKITLRKFLYELYVAGFVALLIFHLLIDYINLNLLAVACGMAGYQANRMLDILNSLFYTLILTRIKNVVPKDMSFPDTFKNKKTDKSNDE